MNELIEKLIDEFETACNLSFDYIEKEKFSQAIQTACEAQRNACSRMYNISDEPYCEQIENAEIEKQDYKNLL